VGLAQDYFREKEFEGTPFWEEFARPNGYLGGAAGVFAEPPYAGWLTAVRRPGHFLGQRDADLFRVLLPHLATSFQIARQLTSIGTIGSIALTTLDHIGLGLCVCNANAQIRCLNSAAREFTCLQPGQRLFLSAQHDGQLRRAVASVARATYGQSVRVPFEDRTGGRRLALVSGINRDQRLSLSESVVAVVFPCREPSLDGVRDVARIAYSFTETEARLAQRLVAGDSVQEAAASLEMSRETARTHLRRMFEKAGVHRQAELVRVLLTSGPN
jgi:DNA-binding CsgD family transcriptional regulator